MKNHVGRISRYYEEASVIDRCPDCGNQNIPPLPNDAPCPFCYPEEHLAWSDFRPETEPEVIEGKVITNASFRALLGIE